MIPAGNKVYRAEVLGHVPNGLTHNEVFASINSLLRDRVKVESVTKRRLAGGMVSVIAKFEAKDSTTASAEVMYAARSLPGFSFDVMVREVKF